MSEQAIENEIVAKGKTAPRITPAMIDKAIVSEHYIRASALCQDENGERLDTVPEEVERALSCLTICVLVLANGFTVTGESACASPENFDATIGAKLAKDHARGKIWPLEGYRLRCSLVETPSSFNAT